MDSVESPNGGSQPGRAQPDAVGVRRFDVLVSISYYVQDRLTMFTGMHPPKIVTIYNGVDTSFFNPKIDFHSFRQSIGTEQDFVILYFGRLTWNKGLTDLRDSIPYLLEGISNVKLIICGKGRMETEVRSRVEKRKPRARQFMGLTLTTRPPVTLRRK